MFSFVSDTVLDPFCGTGTTLVGALKTGRNSIGVEIDREYCRMTALRLQQESEPLFGKTKLQFEIRDPLSPESPIVAEDESIYSVKHKRGAGPKLGRA
jgi:site-specific DNA-methyltransferase (adenine-specific)